MTRLLESLIAQSERCKHDTDDCRFNCKRCTRGRRYARRHGTRRA